MQLVQENMLFIVKELVGAVLLYFVTHLFLCRLINSRRHRLPPGPRGFPVVGCLPLLGDMPHVALAKMAKTYGPIMYLKMGVWGMVVASTPDSACAFLKTLDANFSNRPANAGATILAYNAQDLVFARYGPKWRLLRKLSSLHMLGEKALEAWADVRASEVGHMLEAMHEGSRCGEAVALPEMLVYAMANMIGQVILSRRVFVSKGKEVNEFKEMVVELMTSAGYFNIGDFIPCLAWMDLQRIEKGMKRLHHKFDRLISKMLDEHLKSSHLRKAKPDFLDFLLANRDDDDHINSDHTKLTITNIKAVLLNLFTAGTDTSSSTIEWALAEMMKNPSIQKKAQAEMDRVIGRERRLQESDIPKLTYLQAICKETYRKHPSTPLNLPRVSTEACVVDGFYIPEKTRLSVNIWAIGRDPDVWENPLEFKPERFMNSSSSSIDPKGNHFELIPFGAGRRICAGSRMGMVLVEYILGTLVQSFEWGMPPDTTHMNMDETFGLALQKDVPLQAMLTPRGENLEGHIYSLAAADDLLFTGSDSKNIRVWKNQKEFSEFKSNSGLVKAIIIADERIFFGHQDGKIRVWKMSGKDPSVYKRIGTLPTLKAKVKKSFKPSNYVEVRKSHNAIWIKHIDAISALSLSEDKSILYSASWDKTIKVWRVSDSKCLESINAHDDAVNSVVAGFDGMVFSGSADGTVKVWRREMQGKGTKHYFSQTLLKQECAVTSLAINTPSTVLYCGSSDGLVNFWERDKWRILQRTQAGGALSGNLRHHLQKSWYSELV